MNVTHQEHQADFDCGYSDKMLEITGMGWNAARSKLNADYPLGHQFNSLAAYYYAKGEMQALLVN